ncbi:ATP-binding protein [Candidatus Riflebacteria bacterium]
MEIKKLLLCCCADYQHIADESIRKLFAAAKQAGIEVELCPDLCYEAVENPEFLVKLAEENIAIAACFPRTVQALFARAKVTPATVLNLRTEPLQKILQFLKIEPATGPSDLQLPVYGKKWKAWFPVLDYELCSDCGKCLDYCLFGVYSIRNKKIIVTHPKLCKTDCPACARVCPDKAIIFPKHIDAAINGEQEQDAAVTKSTLPENRFEGDLYARLAKRRKEQRKGKLIKE